MPKLKYRNISQIMRGHEHGWHDKTLAVLHETISHDKAGLEDILDNANYLAGKDYGIHGLTDFEGNAAWALGMGKAVFWQAGGVNLEAIGIEQISDIPMRSQYNTERKRLWALRNKELRATAKLLACWHNTDRKHHLLVYSDGNAPGVTSHWDVSMTHRASDGHTDCKPVHKGGYYPILSVIKVAKAYALAGWHF